MQCEEHVAVYEDRCRRRPLRQLVGAERLLVPEHARAPAAGHVRDDDHHLAQPEQLLDKVAVLGGAHALEEHKVAVDDVVRVWLQLGHGPRLEEAFLGHAREGLARAPERVGVDVRARDARWSPAPGATPRGTPVVGQQHLGLDTRRPTVGEDAPGPLQLLGPGKPRARLERRVANVARHAGHGHADRGAVAEQLAARVDERAEP